MLKIQITAKAIWNGLFLYFIGYALTFFHLIPREKPLGMTSVITIVILNLVCLAILTYTQRSILLPLRLTGTVSVTEESNWRTFFIQINRLACILVGLILLSKSLDILGLITSSIFHLFPLIRDWFTLWIQGDIHEALFQAITGLSYLMYPFGYVLYGIYLVLGSPVFVRKELRQFERYILKESAQ